MKYLLQKFILFATIPFVLGFELQAQNKGIADSLLLLVHNDLPAVEKIQLYLKISRNGLPGESLRHAKKAFEIADEIGNTTLMAESLEEISLCQRVLGNNVQAVEASLDALKIYEKLGLRNRKAALFVQIGSHLTNDKDFQNGLKYIRQGLSIYEQIKDTFNIALAQINLGETYRLLGQLDSAAHYFQKSILINKQLKEDLIQGYAVGNLGLVHAALGNFSLAKRELEVSVKLLTKLGDPYSVSVFQSEIGKLFLQQGKAKEGAELLHKSLSLAQHEHLKEQIRDININLAQYYESTGLLRQAIHFRKQYEIYHDSLLNIDRIRKIEQMQNNFALEKKEADIRLLQESNNKKQLILILFATGSCLLLTLSFFLYRIAKQRKKALTCLVHQKAMVEKKEEENSLLLKELNHRVKNNLQLVSSLFSLQAFQMKDHPAAEALKIGKLRVEAISMIHQKLYRKDLNVQIDLKDYIEELVRNLVHIYNRETILRLNLSPVTLSIEQAIPLGLLINELVTNSLKYAFQDNETPTLSVQLKKTNRHLQLTIADNGPGLPEELNWEKAKSLGLRLVHSLTRQLNGNITYSNTQGCSWRIRLTVTELQPSATR